jgi:SPP1 gp7 family putative phage head morphogenesis protein
VKTLPANFWQDEKRRLIAILGPRLEASAQSGVEAAFEQVQRFGIGFNAELAHEAAAHWAKLYTDDLLNLLNTTSERLVGEALGQWLQKPGAPLDEFVQQLTPEFGPSRANAIAVTEITRAYAQGNKTAYQAANVTQWRWRTNNDELVCRICGPLNNSIKAIGEPFGYLRGKAFTQPPAHPNCRCWVTPIAPQKVVANGG